MWLTDLEKAIAKMREELCDFNFINIESIKPIWGGGIAFRTTYFTTIKVYRNGVIEEVKDE